MSSSSDSFRVAILLCYHVLCDIVCLWVAHDFNILNPGYEHRLPLRRELLGAWLPPPRSSPSAPTAGAWRKGNIAAERGDRYLGPDTAEMSMEKEWELLWQGIPTREGERIIPWFSHFFQKFPSMAWEQAELPFFFFFSLFKCVGFKWQWKVSVLIQQLQQFVPQHERWGDCHVHWKRRDPWRRSVTEFALLFLI